MTDTKQAKRDAAEYARAQMFFGEGAGTRRKLLKASIDSKILNDPAYAEAFQAAYQAQDMGEHAEAARKERKNIDRKASAKKNVRGVLTGNKQSFTTGVLVVSTIAYTLHQTGLDKIIYDKVKQKVRHFRNRCYAKKTVADWTKPKKSGTVYKITSL